MVLKEQLFTADDAWEMAQDNDKHFELIEGVIFHMAPTGFLHGTTTSNLTVFLGIHINKHKLGIITAAETGYRLADNTVIAPDIAFIRADRVPKDPVEGFVPLAPDLAVEVMSPSNNASEMSRKIDLLMQHGTQVVWIVHPKTKTIDVYSADADNVKVTFLKIDDTLTGGTVLPDFTLKLSDLFSE